MLALLLIAATPAPVDQVLAGPAFERFAQATDRLCPARHLRAITPGDLDYAQEGFVDALPAASRRRLRAANTGAARCSRDGLSCPTTELLGAMRRTALLPAFTRYACAHPPPR